MNLYPVQLAQVGKGEPLVIEDNEEEAATNDSSLLLPIIGHAVDINLLHRRMAHASFDAVRKLAH